MEYYMIKAHGDLGPDETWTPNCNFTPQDGTDEFFQSECATKPCNIGAATIYQY
jgi:hypothetical protein